MEQNTGNRPVLKRVTALLEQDYSFCTRMSTRDFACTVIMWKEEPEDDKWKRPHKYALRLDWDNDWPFMHAIDAARTYIKLVGRDRAWEEVQWLEATEYERA